MTRWFEQYTAYAPIHTTTTTSTWSGWQTVSPRCYGCLHSVVTSEKVVCYCVSRIIRNGIRGDICESYFGRDAR